MRRNKLWNKKEFVLGFFTGWIFTIFSCYIIFLSMNIPKDPLSPAELEKRPEARMLKARGYYHFAYTVPPPFPQHFKLLERKFDENFVYKFQASKNSVSEELHERMKIFCFINTETKFHKTRAQHVKATWASHCNRFIFFSSSDDPSLPAINLNIELGREHLWMKTKSMLHYLERHIKLDDFDWFYRADDDTYAIIENLRLMLLPYSPNDDYYFGFEANASKIEHRDFSFVASGAGFLLSRAGLKRLLRDGLTNESKCEKGDHVLDDQKLSDCLKKLGIPVTDSRDSYGRHRFMAVPPDRVLVPVQLAKADSNWIHYWTQHHLEQGPDCCSDYAVAFHYVEPPMMYLLEYLIFHFKAFGIERKASETSIKNAMEFSKKLQINSILDA